MVLSWLRRLLPILAVVGMVTAPVAAVACAGAMAAANATMSPAPSDKTMSDHMPCCPNQQQTPGSGKATCPLMGLCAAQYLANGSVTTSVLPLPVIAAKLFGPRAETLLASLAPSPPTRPPRI